MLTWIADDPAGRDISRWLAESGVALDERSWGAQRTTSARADIDGDGIATYTFDFSWDLRASDIGSVDLVHFGSVSALSEPGATSLLDLLRGVRPQKRFTTTYDPNIVSVQHGRGISRREMLKHARDQRVCRSRMLAFCP